jgi:uncharacterized protein (DUF1499 family)
VNPAVSVAAVTLALCVLAAAPLGWRLGWWSFGFALFSVIPASGTMAAVAVAITLVTLALAGPKLGWRMLVMLLAVLVVAVGLAGLPLRYSHLFDTLPSINDITTDSESRPPFEAALAAREAESADRYDTPEPELTELQRSAYPDIAPVRATLPATETFGAALAVAQAMAGWTIVAVDRDRGRIEASERSRWFGFTDDVVIRVMPEQGGSRIDVRSASRIGSHDLGVNAARVRAYVAALSKAVGQIRR